MGILPHPVVGQLLRELPT